MAEARVFEFLSGHVDGDSLYLVACFGKVLDGFASLMQDDFGQNVNVSLLFCQWNELIGVHDPRFL